MIGLEGTGSNWGGWTREVGLGVELDVGLGGLDWGVKLGVGLRGVGLKGIRLGIGLGGRTGGVGLKGVGLRGVGLGGRMGRVR